MDGWMCRGILPKQNFDPCVWVLHAGCLYGERGRGFFFKRVSRVAVLPDLYVP